MNEVGQFEKRGSTELNSIKAVTALMQFSLVDPQGLFYTIFCSWYMYFSVFLLFFTVRSALVCEGGKQKIRCTHQKIQIISAVYGRTDRSVCQWGLDWTVAWLWNVNCRAANTLAIVKNECETLSECELHANNAEYGDPCFGTKKYLTVNNRLFLRTVFENIICCS